MMNSLTLNTPEKIKRAIACQDRVAAEAHAKGDVATVNRAIAFVERWEAKLAKMERA